MPRSTLTTTRLPRTILGMIGLALVATLLGQYEARSAGNAGFSVRQDRSKQDNSHDVQTSPLINVRSSRLSSSAPEMTNELDKQSAKEAKPSRRAASRVRQAR